MSVSSRKKASRLLLSVSAVALSVASVSSPAAADSAAWTLSSYAGLSHSADGATAALSGAGSIYDVATTPGVASPTEAVFIDRSTMRLRKINLSTGAVTTIAGSGKTALTDGTGAAAAFNDPRQVVLDASGNAYVAEDNAIRKVVLATGVVTTLAGAATSGNVVGAAATARFDDINGITLSLDYSTVWVSDTGNNVIKSVATVDGATTLRAGTGAQGALDNADPLLATFNAPRGLATAPSGDIAIADSGSRKVRLFNVTTPAITTHSGDGTAASTATSFMAPNEVAYASNGDLYITDGGWAGWFGLDPTTAKVRVVTSGSATITTLAGSGAKGYADNAAGTSAQFRDLSGLAVAGTNVFIADAQNSLLRTMATASTNAVSTVGSMPTDDSNGTGTAARFSTLSGIAADGSGNIFVADTANGLIRKIASGGVVTTFAGSGALSLADGTGAAASFRYPSGLAFSQTGDLYVSELGAIRKITSAGVVTTLAGSNAGGSIINGTGAAARFSGAAALVVTTAGDVYVVDQGNHAIRKVTAAGVVTTVAGTGSTGAVDGTGTAASFASPSGIAMDQNGDLFVADTGNNRIRKIVLATGVVTTYLGSAAGVADGTGAAATFTSPKGVTFGATGNMVVTSEDSIREVTPALVVTTLANSTNGAPSKLYILSAATVSAGSIFFTDYEDGVVRRLTPVSTAPGAPTIGAATTALGKITVTWTAPALNGGSAINNYQVTCTPTTGTAVTDTTESATALTLAVTPTAFDVAHTCVVKAGNAVGWSVASAASNAVTPKAVATTTPPVTTTPPAPTVDFSTLPQTLVVTGGAAKIIQGDKIHIKATGFAPNEVTQIWIRSTPVYVGSLTASASGVVEGDITVPEGLSDGTHILAVLNAAGTAGSALSFTVDSATATKLPFSGNAVNLSMMMLATAAGALGLFLRRRTA